MSSSFKLGMALAITTIASGPLPRANAGIIFNTFATPNSAIANSPIGFAYAGNKFVGSLYLNSGPTTFLYSTDLNGGNVQQFAPTISIPTGNPEEHFVASSLGQAGFPNRDIYVSAIGRVIHITNDGSSGGTFVSGLSGEVRGIVFDSIGTFGHQMLVSTSTGTIYKVDSGGNAVILANIGQDTEGMDIAPAGFGSFAGQLFVGSEGPGLVRAIDPLGNVTVLNPSNPIPGAEQLAFVPLNLGSSGSSLEGLYSADFPVDVVKADASQFTGFLGDLIVSGEFDHQVTRVHFNGSSFEYSNVGQLPHQPEDGIFVTAGIINPGSPGVPEPASLVLLSIGGLGLLGFARRGWKKAN